RALPLAPGVVCDRRRHTRLRDGVERRNQVRGDLVEIAPPGRHDPLAVVSELLVVHVEELAAGAAAAEKGIALVEDTRKTLRVLEKCRVTIENRTVEEAPPAPGAAAQRAQVLGREHDDVEVAEVFAQRPRRLAVQADVLATAADGDVVDALEA